MCILRCKHWADVLIINFKVMQIASGAQIPAAISATGVSLSGVIPGKMGVPILALLAQEEVHLSSFPDFVMRS